MDLVGEEPTFKVHPDDAPKVRLTHCAIEPGARATILVAYRAIPVRVLVHSAQKNPNSLSLNVCFRLSDGLQGGKQGGLGSQNVRGDLLLRPFRIARQQSLQDAFMFVPHSRTTTGM